MQLHHIQSFAKKKKRVGRGGKRGTTSGRGTKGQKSRSGHVIRPAERDLLLKFPKKRGFRNKAKSEKPLALNLDNLQSALAGRAALGNVVVNRQLLKEAGLLGSRFRGQVKILGDGGIKFPVTIAKEVSVSKSASEKILSAGGKIEK